MRLLYGHSFQSFIWNRMVSLRIQRHGLRAVPGDFVLASTAAAAAATTTESAPDAETDAADESVRPLY